MRGRELLSVARELARGPASGPHARSAISRAYYAAYTETAHYAARYGYQHSPNRGSHARTWNFMAQVNDGHSRRKAERHTIRSQGKFLKQQRMKADYQPFASLQANAARGAIQTAKGIIDALDRLLP